MEPSRKTLDRYELRAVLARSAGGIVYEGWDSRIARKVAIKTVTLPDAADADLQDKIGRFKREAQAAGRLQHPNIVGIYDYGEIDDIAFIVMEFVDGVPLKSLFDRHERFEGPTILRVMDGVLAGLQYSHDRGIVHRDIKPSNIMLTADGRAKIADFGIARIESSSMTQAGTVMGTPAYMSPEQFLGETVDLRTDIYSAGVVLYQMLTGERPYDGGVATIMHKVLHTKAVKPSQLSTQSSPMLDAIVTKAMAKRREDRFATAALFAEALQATVDSTVIARAPAAPRPDRPRPTPSRPTARPPAPARHPPARLMAAAIAGLAVLAGVGGGAAWLAGGGTPTPQSIPQSAPTPVAAPLPPVAAQLPPAAAPRQGPFPATPQDGTIPAPAPPPEAQPSPNAPSTADLPQAPGPTSPGATPASPPPQPRSAFWMPVPATPEAAPTSPPATRLAARPRQPCEHPAFPLRMRTSVALLRVMNDGQACGAKLFADGSHHVPLESLAIETPPAHGVVRLDGSEYAYVPEPGFIGSDSFRLTASPAHSIRFDVSVVPARSEAASTNPPPSRSGPPAQPDNPSPWIGLQTRPVNGDDAAALGLGGPTGLLVTGVDYGGPAARAMLRPSDVVLAFNGTVLSGPDSLARAMRAASIGEAVPVEIWRDRQIMKLRVEPASAPGRPFRPGPAD